MTNSSLSLSLSPPHSKRCCLLDTEPQIYKPPPTSQWHNRPLETRVYARHHIAALDPVKAISQLPKPPTTAKFS